VAAARIVERAQVASCGQKIVQFALRDQAGAAVPEFFERRLFGGELRDLSGLVGHLHMAVDPVALDGVAGNALPKQTQTLDRDVPDGTRIGRPDEALERRLALGDTGEDLTAIASGGAPARPLRLQQHHPEALFSQLKGRGAARHPSPHNAHIGRNGGGQGRGGDREGRRRAVVAFGVTGKGLRHRARIPVPAPGDNKTL